MQYLLHFPTFHVFLNKSIVNERETVKQKISMSQHRPRSTWYVSPCEKNEARYFIIRINAFERKSSSTYHSRLIRCRNIYFGGTKLGRCDRSARVSSPKSMALETRQAQRSVLLLFLVLYTHLGCNLPSLAVPRRIFLSKFKFKI